MPHPLSTPLKLLDDEGEIYYQRNPSGFDDHGTEELEEVMADGAKVEVEPKYVDCGEAC